MCCCHELLGLCCNLFSKYYQFQVHLVVNLLGYCSLGSSVIDWLLKWRFADSRDGACRLAEKLLCQAHILPLLPCHEKKSTDVTPAASKCFCDSSDSCYRFVRISIRCCMLKALVISCTCDAVCLLIC